AGGRPEGKRGYGDRGEKTMNPATMKIFLANSRKAARELRHAESARKSAALSAAAYLIGSRQDEILAANAHDLAKLEAGATPAFRDRLTLDPARIAQMAEGLRQVVALADPVGEVVESRILRNGLKIQRVRSPLGVIFMIFESR